MEKPVDAIFWVAETHLPHVFGTTFDRWEAFVRGVLPSEWVAGLDAFLATSGSVHARRLPLMNPYDVLLLVVAYLAMIVVGVALMSLKADPKPTPKQQQQQQQQQQQESRKGFQVKWFALWHNFTLTLLSGYMCLELLRQAFVVNHYKIFGNPCDETAQGWSMAKIAWLFYVSKIVEFIDTLIMILKKNYRQISFLHVYHHFSIFTIWWLVTFLAPGGEAYFSAFLNSFVHVVMYGYYFLTALGVEQVRFVKYYITKLQMTQFLLMLIQSIFDIYTGGGGYPQLTTRILFVYMISLLLLFANFLRQDQKRTRASRHEEKKKQ